MHRHTSQALCLAALGVILLSGSSRAATVIEWQFNDAADQTIGGTVSLTTPVVGASTVSTLQAISTGTASYSTASTGIDAGTWQPYLGSGYLQTSTGSYNTSAGLITRNDSTGRYPKYLGFSGFGTGSYVGGADDGKPKGGTAYFVFQPGSTAWNTSTQRRALFGVGYNSDGATSGGNVSLYSIKTAAGSPAQLAFRVARGETAAAGHNTAIDFNGDGDNLDFAAVETRLTVGTWDLTKWYFAAASWRTGEAPLLYFRELDGASTALQGALLPLVNTQTTGTKDNLFLATIPTGIEPNAQPIAIGSTWYDAGGGGNPAYGLGGKIAYGRIDNVFSTATDMNAVFQSLMVPEPTTMSLLLLGACGLVRRRRA